MKKLLILLSLALGFGFSSQAQKNYNTALGIQLGIPTGVRAKHYLSDANSVEGVLGWRRYYGGGDLWLQGHYEWNYAAFDVDEFSWYWGIGGFGGYYSYTLYDQYDGYRKQYYDEKVKGTWIGVSAIFGLEYTLQNAPLSFGVNVTPGIKLLPGMKGGLGAGINVNYTFK